MRPSPSPKALELLARLKDNTLTTKIHPYSCARQWRMAGARVNVVICLSLIDKELIATDDDLLADNQVWHLTEKGQAELSKALDIPLDLSQK